MKWVVVAVMLAGCAKEPSAAPEPAPVLPFAKFGVPLPDGSEVGRFVLHQGANFTMRMDTETGMTWVFHPEDGKWGVIIEAPMPEPKPAAKRWR